MVSSRSDWTGGVAASHAELEAIDDDEAVAMTYAERLALVWQLSQAFDWSEDDGDDDGATVRILGSECGVRSATRLAPALGADAVGTHGCARAPTRPRRRRGRFARLRACPARSELRCVIGAR